MELATSAADAALVAQSIPARVRALEIEATFLALAAARRHLDQLEYLAVEHWKKVGLSWQDIADPLGQHRQSVRRRHLLLSEK
jgi:predicted ArsR family transcriptional regulator